MVLPLALGNVCCFSVQNGNILVLKSVPCPSGIGLHATHACEASFIQSSSVSALSWSGLWQQWA